MSTGVVDAYNWPMDIEGLDLTTFHSLIRIVEHLRSPEGCPWDREQTHDSLRSALIQECYEVLDAIDQNDPKMLAEELGDVLVHVVLHAQMAKEAGEFAIEEVLKQASEKLVRRHPHVFGDSKAANAWEVEKKWEEIKRKERAGTDTSILDGVPREMPSLAHSQAIQDRASRSGFDWDEIKGVLAKVQEELSELDRAASQKEREAELGDILFALVNTGRWLGIDTEGALRRANARFYRRFTHMEKLCLERSLSFTDLSMSEKEALWQEAKAHLGE